MTPTPIRPNIDPRLVVRLPRVWQGPAVRLVAAEQPRPDARRITPFPVAGPAIA